jgi:hypothetical protein
LLVRCLTASAHLRSLQSGRLYFIKRFGVAHYHPTTSSKLYHLRKLSTVSKHADLWHWDIALGLSRSVHAPKQ